MTSGRWTGARPGRAWAPVGAALLVGALLLASALYIRRSIQEASALLTRGIGGSFGMALQATFGPSPTPPDDAQLEAFLAEHQEAGLRYVAVVEEGQLVARAGEARGRTLQDGAERVGTHVRLAHPLRLGRPWPRALRDGPRPGPRERRRVRVIYEFEPVAALALEAQARQLLALAVVAGLGMLALSLAFSRGLAQRERLQAQLEQDKRLAALGSMSAVLAHELRNPLASLKGHAQLLSESVEEDVRLHPKAERVVREAVRLEHLLNDLLAFVKSGELKRAPTDPNQVLAAAVEAVGAQAIQVQPLAGAPTLSLDAGRLQQALENVLRNAVQASPEGAHVQAQVAQEDGTLVYTVRDAGPGIRPGEEERIFEPFVTGRVKGVGLGLAITRRVVELHGGSVRATNNPEGGACFRLTLPQEEA